MNAQDREKLLARMKKIMALATNAGATEGEREAALHQLHKLMAKHNIDQATVEGVDLNKQVDNIDGHVLEKHEFYGRPWAKTIVMGVAKMMFCKYFTQDSAKKNMTIHCFVGTAENVAAAVMLAQFLINGVKTEGERRAKAMGENVSAYRRAFGTGASGALYSRCLDEMRKPPEGGSTALVLTNVYEQAERLNQLALSEKFGIRLRARNSNAKTTGVGDALSAGRAHGNSMNLGRNIG